MKPYLALLAFVLLGCASQTTHVPVSVEKLDTGSLVVGGTPAKGKQKSSIGPGTIDRGVQDTPWGEMRVFESLVPKMYKFPETPWFALKRVYGQAVVVALVGVDGVPRDVRISSSSTDRDIDSAAIAAFKSWRFHPVIEDGRPIPVVARQLVAFQ